MDYASGILLELKEATKPYLTRKLFIPLSILPILWLVFFKRLGKISKEDVKSRKAIKSSLREGGSGEEYNLKGLVSALPVLFKLSMSREQSIECQEKFLNN